MEIEREIVLPVPPEEAWEALTEPEQLEEWFANDVELDPARVASASFAGTTATSATRSSRRSRRRNGSCCAGTTTAWSS